MLTLASCQSNEGVIFIKKELGHDSLLNQIIANVKIQVEKSQGEEWRFLQFVSCESLDTGEPYFETGHMMDISSQGFALDRSFYREASIYFPDCRNDEDHVELIDHPTRQRNTPSKNPFLWKALAVPVCMDCSEVPIAGPIIQYQFLNQSDSIYYPEILHGIRRSNAEKIVRDVLQKNREAPVGTHTQLRNSELEWLKQLVFQ